MFLMLYNLLLCRMIGWFAVFKLGRIYRYIALEFLFVPECHTGT
jgi:hypothetical protein